jgi:uncharacterized membrane protein
VVDVTEILEVDYRANEKHGIFRDIPYVYQDEGRTKTYTEIQVKNVLRDSAKEPYEIQKNDGNIRIKIGDAGKTISGKHEYQILYTAKGILRSFSDHDELYWNVTGNNWPTNIDAASSVVILPKGKMEKVACYEGYSGSPGECQSEIDSPTSASYTASRFISEGEGMTIVAGFTKGLVPIIVVPRPKTFWEKFIEWPSQVTLWTGILGALGFIVYTWYKKGRDPWFGQSVTEIEGGQEKPMPIGAHETVVVEFTPPENLRPAEIGVLMDQRADTVDVVATIIDLATRGYLTITEVPKKWVFGSTDYELIQKKQPDTSLRNYEKILLNKLFDSGDIVRVSSLKQTFYEELKQVKDALYTDVVTKGFFPKNPDQVWQNYFATGIVFVVLGGVGISITVGNDLIILSDLCFALIVAGVLFVLFSFFMPRRSAKGREMYRRARGYHLFINSAEKYRQQFFEKKNLFNEVLPYAIMFGLTDKFFNAMKDIGIKPSTTWYVGSHPFSYSGFNSSMGAFTSSMSTAIASTPKSSGGFSGGSSGGGFGGGGGGSW